jgi:hypothetical protein
MKFQLECGPSLDRRLMIFDLPDNNVQGNSILVSYTGGIDSALLLYLLAKLNNEQSIPYFIQPLVIDNRLGSADDPNNKFAAAITEIWPRIPDTIKSFQKTFSNSQILPLIKRTAHPKIKQTAQIGIAIQRVYRTGNYQYIYSGTNENPSDLECPGGPSRRPIEFVKDPLKVPFLTLKKTHIMDIIIQLGAFEIFELCTKCVHHTSLEEVCSGFNCRERWWALRSLQREDLIVKYFLNQDQYAKN